MGSIEENAQRLGRRLLMLMAALSLMALVAGMFAAAWGHSWYDPDCCSDRDCAVAEVLEVDGRIVLRNQYGMAPLPPTLIPRTSRDENWHACFDYTKTNLRCVYAPAGS